MLCEVQRPFAVRVCVTAMGSTMRVLVVPSFLLSGLLCAPTALLAHPPAAVPAPFRWCWATATRMPRWHGCSTTPATSRSATAAARQAAL